MIFKQRPVFGRHMCICRYGDSDLDTIMYNMALPKKKEYSCVRVYAAPKVSRAYMLVAYGVKDEYVDEYDALFRQQVYQLSGENDIIVKNY